MEFSKSERKRKLEKLKKMRSVKGQHSNSFVLSNISILKKSNVELAKKLSASQADLLSCQEKYHISWQQNFSIGMELKECKLRLKEVEAELAKKDELLNNIKPHFDNISELFMAEYTERNWKKCDVKKNLVKKTAGRIPFNLDHENMNGIESVETVAKPQSPQRLVSNHPVQTTSMFQYAKSKTAKTIPAPSLMALEEDDSETDLLQASKSAPQKCENSCNKNANKLFEERVLKSEINNSTTICSTNKLPSQDRKLCTKANNNCHEEDNILNSTTHALKLLPRQKKKRKKSSVQNYTENIDVSSVYINLPESEGKQNDIDNKENLTTESQSKQSKGYDNKPQKPSSPLRLYLDPNDTLASEADMDVGNISVFGHGNEIQFHSDQKMLIEPERKSKRSRRGNPVNYKEPSLTKKLRRTK